MSLLGRIQKGGGNDGGNNQQGGGNKPPDDKDREAAMLRRKQALAQQQGGVRPGGAGRGENSYVDLKTRVQNKLIAELDHVDQSRKNEIRQHIEELFNAILAEESMVLSKGERQRLFEAIVADILGFGPIEILLADDSITEVMVNGPKNIFVERKGHLT
ncbi:MAG: CpaF family protein, partial [Anaerolineae bacterium]|nr:CpaF family protein [Anaerolineae bacterium]